MNITGDHNTAPPSPEQTLNAQFLSLLTIFPGNKFAAPIVCSFAGDPEGDGVNWNGAPWTPEYTPGPETNNYVSVSLHKLGPFRSGRRVFSSFVELRAVLVDDVGTKVTERRATGNGLLTPTLAVETSPGNFQYWYVLHPGELVLLDRSRHTLKAIAKFTGTADCVDPVHYGRLPEGTNEKEKYRLNGKPWRQIVHIWERARTFKIYEIDEAFNVPEFKHRDPRPLAPEPEGSGIKAQTHLRWIEDLGLYISPDKTPGWHQVLCPWRRNHKSGTNRNVVYIEPSALNEWKGGFKCFHSECAMEERGINQFLDSLGALHQQKVSHG